MSLKVDMERAYDRLSWDFVKMVLTSLDFTYNLWSELWNVFF